MHYYSIVYIQRGLQTSDAFLTSGTGAHGSMVDKLEDACVHKIIPAHIYMHTLTCHIEHVHSGIEQVTMYILLIFHAYMCATADDDRDQLCII